MVFFSLIRNFKCAKRIIEFANFHVPDEKIEPVEKFLRAIRDFPHYATIVKLAPGSD